MNRIGIVDVDGTKFPNLALMKISAWHKQQGDDVEFANALFGCYDRVYQSKVFTFTPDTTDIFNCEVVKGGTGYDIASKLPDEIDRLQPDYSLYGITESRKADTVVVLLIPARTDTKYFHKYIYHNAAEIRFIEGRLRFGDSKQGAPFPSMIVVFRRNY